MAPRTPWLGLMVTTLLVGLGLTEGGSGPRTAPGAAEAVVAGAASAAGGASMVTLPVSVLVGGGLLVLAGTVLEGVLPGPALVLTALGCGASLPAALWTVVVPVMLCAFLARRAWQLPLLADAAAGRPGVRPAPVPLG